MKRAGTVVGTAQGLAIVRTTDETYPGIGTGLIDESLDSIGRVVDVFGPVDRPYLAVSTSTENPALLVSSPVYARE